MPTTTRRTPVEASSITLSPPAPGEMETARQAMLHAQAEESQARTAFQEAAERLRRLQRQPPPDLAGVSLEDAAVVVLAEQQQAQELTQAETQAQGLLRLLEAKSRVARAAQEAWERLRQEHGRLTQQLPSLRLGLSRAREEQRQVEAEAQRRLAFARERLTEWEQALQAAEARLAELAGDGLAL